MRLLDILSPKNSPPNEKGAGFDPSGRDIITDLKAIKNETEQAQLRQVMAIDGAAMVRFHNWLRPKPCRLDADSPKDGAENGAKDCE